LHPQEFLNMATYLDSLTKNPNQTKLLNPEIIRRTHVNRSYYFLYHTTRKALLEVMTKDNQIESELTTARIKLHEIFQHHWTLIKFYEDLAEILKQETQNTELADLAEDVSFALKTYKILRELADYHIDIHNPKKVKHKIDFLDPTKTPTTWNLLSINSLQNRANEIITKTNKLFKDLSEITLIWYPQIIRDILEKIEFQLNTKRKRTS